jgi:hypothetical protein
MATEAPSSSPPDFPNISAAGGFDDPAVSIIVVIPATLFNGEPPKMAYVFGW